MKEGHNGGAATPLAVEVLAGLTSGAAQTIVGAPLEIVKLRQQGQS